ncbi:hypothetical protein, partial [Burkholderia pseudomallei]|uniref:hypothetical protein n=1 Tax=Burkholderia pseudomallei TaxID=28450 RepID=UPI0019D38516
SSSAALTGTATSNTSSSRSAPRSPGFRDEPFLLHRMEIESYLNIVTALTDIYKLSFPPENKS